MHKIHLSYIDLLLLWAVCLSFVGLICGFPAGLVRSAIASQLWVCNECCTAGGLCGRGRLRVGSCVWPLNRSWWEYMGCFLCADFFLQRWGVSYWCFMVMCLLGSGRWVICKGESRHKTVWRYYQCFLNDYLQILHFKFAYSISQSCVSMNISVWAKLLVVVCSHSEKLVLGVELVWSLLHWAPWSLYCRSIFRC